MSDIPGIFFMESYYLALHNLPDKDRLMLYDSIFSYAFDGADPALPEGLAPFFTLIKPNIDSSITRYRNGSKGGRPKKNK